MEKQKIEVEIYNGAGYEAHLFDNKIDAGIFMSSKLDEAKEKFTRLGKSFEVCSEGPYIYLKGNHNAIYFQMRAVL